MEVPEWVVLEVGRLYLNNLALSRDLAARQPDAEQREEGESA